MKTYTNPVHPEQGFDPRSKDQVRADRESQSEETENQQDDNLGSDDDNLDDGSGSTENPAVRNSMN